MEVLIKDLCKAIEMLPNPEAGWHSEYRVALLKPVLLTERKSAPDRSIEKDHLTFKKVLNAGRYTWALEI